MNTPRPKAPPTEVIRAYPPLETARFEPITVGHINQTFVAHTPKERYILQRLNAIFDPRIHHDINAITHHLRGAGLATPLLQPTARNELWTTDTNEGVWRLWNFLPGTTHTKTPGPDHCRAAGALLGRFHAALWAFEYAPVAPKRVAVHDTERHMHALNNALHKHSKHVAHAKVRSLAEPLMTAFEKGPKVPNTPPRWVHGDPKLSNILFIDAHRANAFVDLDTLGIMAVPLEIGDALRSWCNTAEEDDPKSAFDPTLFAAALTGYRQGFGRTPPDAAEDAFIIATKQICMELAARFLRDALEESYFGWDAHRYPAAWAHHLARGRAQWALAQSIEQQYKSLSATARHIVASPHQL